MKRFIVYQIINLVNNKKYIGKTEKNINERYMRHLSEAKHKINKPLYDSINHHGIDKFKIEILEKCKSSQQLCNREIYWINFYNTTKREYGYNLTLGGTGGDNFSCRDEEGKQKILLRRSISNLGKNKGKKCPEYQKELLRKLYKGKTYDEIHGVEKAKLIKEKISKANKISQNKSEVREAKIKHATGLKRSKEVGIKIGNKLRGRKHSQISKDKMSKTKKEKNRYINTKIQGS